MAKPTPTPMEVDDEDPIKMWRDPHAYPPIPSAFIPCPLNESQLEEHYSLSLQGKPTSYTKQEDAMTAYFSNPPLTKPIPTSTTKRAKSNMRKLGQETIIMRVRTMDEFVGFCSKWLHMKPCMELAMDPQLVAKYMGFHVAKGTQEGTLKRISTHLHQSIPFINSTHCPRLSPPQDDATFKGTMDWFTNLNGSILASISMHHNTKEQGTTLWSVWEATITKWEAFQTKLKVGLHACMWCIHGWCIELESALHSLPPTHTPCV